MPKTNPVTATKQFTLPTGQEIYDRIMITIEPELVLSNIKKLDAPYSEETPAKRKARYARYTKAFAAYQKQYKAWIKNLNSAVQVYKRAVVKASEKVSQQKDDSVLADLESQMNAA